MENGDHYSKGKFVLQVLMSAFPPTPCPRLSLSTRDGVSSWPGHFLVWEEKPFVLAVPRSAYLSYSRPRHQQLCLLGDEDNLCGLTRRSLTRADEVREVTHVREVSDL